MIVTTGERFLWARPQPPCHGKWYACYPQRTFLFGLPYFILPTGSPDAQDVLALMLPQDVAYLICVLLCAIPAGVVAFRFNQQNRLFINEKLMIIMKSILGFFDQWSIYEIDSVNCILICFVGLCTVGTVIAEIFFFDEPFQWFSS